MPSSYFVRLTPREPISYEDIENFLESIHINQWVVCFEQGSKKGADHYHLCLFSERGPENMRFHFKRAFNAQVYISGKEIDDKIRAVAYCFKDGNYRHKNLDVSTFLMAKQLSHKKLKFEDELKTIVDGEAPIRESINAILDLHIKYNKKIYRQHIKAIVELMRLKREPQYREKLMDYFLNDY